MKKILTILVTILLFDCTSKPDGDSTIGTSLLGVVYDSRSNPVQDATLDIYNLEESLLQTIKSDINGKFYINELPFDEYRVKITADRTVDTHIDINHYDIENVLILRIKTFEDRVRDLELNLKDKNWDLSEEIIEELEVIDNSDIYFLYLKAIYFVKTNDYESAEATLLPYKNRNYLYIDRLLEDITNEKLN